MGSLNRSLILGASLLFFGTLLAYLPALRGGFIWDDDHYVTQNAELRSLDGLRRIWVEPTALPQYYPAVHSTFWVEYQLWGLRPFGYHLNNILLHGFSAVLLWLVLRALGVSGGWWAAALFAIHPVQVESVAWITERKNVLSGLFALAAFLSYLHSAGLAEEVPAKYVRGKTRFFYRLALILFLLALLSKTVTAVLPVVFCLIHFWKKGRLEKKDAVSVLPFLALGGFMGGLTLWLEIFHVGASGEEWLLSWPSKFLLAGRVFWFYLEKIVWPFELTFVYPRWDFSTISILACLFPTALLGLVLSLWAGRKKFGRGPLTAVAFVAVSLIPVSGFFPVFPFRYSFVADHFQYLSSIGWFVLIVGVGRAAGSTGALQFYLRRVPAMGTVLPGAVLLLLGFLTWTRAGVFADAERLWRDTLVKNPSSWMANMNFGNLLLGQGRWEEARGRYERALVLKPRSADLHFNLGNLLVGRGESDLAARHYERALAVAPGHFGAGLHLGNVFAQSGALGLALRRYEELVRYHPNSSEARFSLAKNLEKMGGHAEAAAEYRKALSIEPGYSQAHNSLGALLFREGKLDEAETHFQSALRLTPGSARVRFNLGALAARLGNWEAASDSFSAAIRIRPNFADAHHGLAVAHYRRGELSPAIEAMAEAVRLSPGSRSWTRQMVQWMDEGGGSLRQKPLLKQAP